MLPKYTSLLLAALALLLSALPVAADGIIIPVPPPHRPPPQLRSLAIKYHHVDVIIEDGIATTHVDQVFLNESPDEIEGQYVFPIPEDAAISGFRMWVDGRPLEAQILEWEEARRLYESIVRERKDPALLEYAGRNAFRARIYPIPAWGEKRIELEYTEVLNREGSLVKYVYPLNTERFSSRPLEDVRVSVRIKTRELLRGVYSPSHEISTSDSTEHGVAVTCHERAITPDTDFVLYYTLGDDALSINLLGCRDEGEDGFFLMLLTPSPIVPEDRVISRDVIFVLDTSGSMRGEKLEQARGAVLYVLEGLGGRDRFGVVGFGSGVGHYAKRLCDISEMTEARRFVRELRAGGGTNIDMALREALALVDPERPTVILFLTDGLPTEGEQRIGKIVERVGDLAGPNVRLFAFGVGYDVNTTLLDALAQNHHGSTTYVRPGENIEQAVSSFYDRIRAPLLTDVALDLGSVRVHDVYPTPLPDVYAGSQLVIVGRYRNGGATRITLSGRVDEEDMRLIFDDMHFREKGGADFIPRLWATRKIGHLLSQVRLYGANQELIDEIVELSVQYGIVTPYTSFLVDETEDALRPEGRQRIAEREALQWGYGLGGQAAPSAEGSRQLSAAPASGQAAVEKAVAEEALRSAQTAHRPDVEQVRTVGRKAFVLRSGVWVDTAFDPQAIKPRSVAFGSEAYFQLAREHPDWGPYLALGERVILVWEGQAYETLPQGAEPPAQPTPTATLAPVEPAAAPTPRATTILDLLRAWFGG